MVWSNLTIGNWKCKYKFPKEKNSVTDLPYCDSKGDIVKRVNETEQLKQKISDLVIEVTKLDFKKQNGTITSEEEDKLKISQKDLAVRQEVMNSKPYYINENTGEILLTASKKLGDEVLTKSKKTSEISREEFRVCEVMEKEKFMKEEKGEMFCPELYKFLMDNGEGKAIKFNMGYGFGNNEQRTYVYPTKHKDFLVMNKVGRTNYEEALEEDIRELEELESLKKVLEKVSLQGGKVNKNLIAGSLD